MIAVVGEALVDAHVDGDSLRLHPGGGPFNTAVALARLGVATAFVSALSTDRLGSLLEQRIRDAGVEAGLLQRTAAPTPVAIVDTTDGQPAYSFYLTATALDEIASVPGPTILDDVRLLHAGTLALAIEPAASAVERLVASEASRRLVMIDPNVRPNVIGDRDAYLARLERLFSSADIVKASAEDLEWLYPGSTVGVLAKRLLADRTSLVVVTHGAAGAEAWTATDHVRIDAPRVQIVDTVGAGDAFGAALIAALDIEDDSASTFGSNLGRRRLKRALRYAAAVGALQCSQSSAWAPTREDVDAFLEQQAVTPVA